MNSKNTIRKIILFVALLLPFFALRAQISYSDTIGNENTTSSLSALPGYYGFNLSAALYTSSEINHANGMIQSLSYHLYYGNTFYWYDQRVKIYLLETTGTSLDLSQTWSQLTSSATLVYDSTDFDLQWDDYWKEFAFSQPFSYHGGNIVVLVEGYACDATGGCETEMYYNYGSSSNCWNRVQDNTPISTTTAMSSIPEGTHGNNTDRADIFFTFNANADTCMMTLPYSENFESYTGFYTDIPTCWQTISDYPTAYNTYYPVVCPGTSSDSQSLMFMVTGTDEEYAILPSIPNNVTMQDLTMSFKYKSTTAQSHVTHLVVGVMSNPADTTTFVGVDTVTKEQSVAGWEDKEINFATYTGTGKHIALLFSGRNSTFSYPSCFVDDVEVYETPDCTAPLFVNSTVSQSGVTLSWTADSSALGVRIYYKSMGDTAYSTVDVLDATSYDFLNLTPGTMYSYYLTTLCDSATESAPSAVDNFTTWCEPVSTFPWTDGFENGAACWAYDSEVPGQNWTLVTNGTNPTCAPHSGSYMMKMNNYAFAAGNWCALISPAFQMTENMQLSYFYHTYSFQMYDDSVEVYYNDTPSLTNATLLKTFYGNSFTEAWNADSVVVPAPTNGGERYVIFKAISDYGFNIFLDDVKLDFIAEGPDTVYVTLDTAVCEGESVTLYGSTYSVAGGYEIVAGDSVITLNLTVNPSYTIVINDTIAEGENYTQNGFNESASGTYYQYLTTEAGCDSTIVLNLSVLVGVNHHENIEMTVYPNPATTHIQLMVPAQSEDLRVELWDISGRCVRQEILSKGASVLEMERGNLPDGIYMLKLTGERGSQTRKVILL